MGKGMFEIKIFSLLTIEYVAKYILKQTKLHFYCLTILKYMYVKGSQAKCCSYIYQHVAFTIPLDSKTPLNAASLKTISALRCNIAMALNRTLV